MFHLIQAEVAQLEREEQLRKSLLRLRARQIAASLPKTARPRRRPLSTIRTLAARLRRALGGAPIAGPAR